MDIVLYVVIGLETVALIVLLVLMLRKKKSQDGMMNKAESIVKGKLNVEDIRIDGADNTTAILASAFNSIKSNLMTFIEATKVNVVTLSDAIDVLSKSVEANKNGNDQIAEGTTNVASKTAEQLELVRDNLILIESSNKQMQEIDEAMTVIKTLLDDTVDISRSGLSNLEGFEKDMDDMSSDLSRINDILTQFNKEIKRIGEVGDFIVGISDQLRLLAFNASIEAARAGQAGRGFTVVADEMNVMSVKTKDGMETINQILKEIITSSKLVNDSIENVEKTYNRSKDTFTEVNSSFRSINEQSVDIYNKMNSISNMFDVMADNSDKSKVKAESLLDTAQSISENTHEIAAVSQEVAAESAKIGENTIELNSMLEGIQNLLKQFNTAVVPTSRNSAKTTKILALSMLDNDFWYGVRKGVLYAQKELADANALIEYYPLNKERPLEEVLTELSDYAIQNDFDGLIFPGFLNMAADNFRKAASAGIKLMTYNCDCDKRIPRVSCLRPDSHEPGIMAAKATDKILNRHGKVLMLTGDTTIDVNVERRDGFKMQLSSMRGVTIADEKIVPDDPDEVYRIALEAIKANTDAGVVFLTNGYPLSVVKAIKDAGMRNKMVLVAFDHNQEIFKAIKEGYIGAAIGQDAFGQGHDPIIFLYNNIVAGEKLPEFIPCRLSIVDKENVDNLVET